MKKILLATLYKRNAGESAKFELMNYYQTYRQSESVGFVIPHYAYTSPLPAS